MPRKRRRAHTTAQRRKNLLRPIPHPGTKCSCARCDQIRHENGNVRSTLGWNADYPPEFYKSHPPVDGWEADWEAANAGQAEADLPDFGLAETF